jgi:hypothetical protein
MKVKRWTALVALSLLAITAMLVGTAPIAAAAAETRPAAETNATQLVAAAPSISKTGLQILPGTGLMCGTADVAHPILESSTRQLVYTYYVYVTLCVAQDGTITLPRAIAQPGLAQPDPRITFENLGAVPSRYIAAAKIRVIFCPPVSICQFYDHVVQFVAYPFTEEISVGTSFRRTG